ncbi:MAG: hypothetical protein ACREEL_05465 [Stellaceae bacterium]
MTPQRRRKIKEWAMGRIVRASLVAGFYFALASPGFAQTNEACVLRCLDHGNLDQTCEARCTNGVPPASAPAPSRIAQPAQQPAVQAAPPLAAPSSTAPPAVPPAAATTVPQSNVTQPAPQQSAPQPSVGQATPQQLVKPPASPINEACVLRCLDHGHLDQYCDRVCALPVPGGSSQAAPPPADGK